MRLPWLIVRAAVLVALTAGCAAAAPPSTSTPAARVPAMTLAAPSSSPSPSTSSSTVVLKLASVAENMNKANSKPTWSTETMSAPADQAFQIVLRVTNSDTHNILIKDSTEQVAFDGDDLVGPGTKTYDVPALAAGTYSYICTYYPLSMKGTLTVGG